jgi:hypothetical protein
MKYHTTEYTLGTVLTLADGRRFAFLEPKQQVIKFVEAVPWSRDSPTINATTANATCTERTPKNGASARNATRRRNSIFGQ